MSRENSCTLRFIQTIPIYLRRLTKIKMSGVLTLVDKFEKHKSHNGSCVLAIDSLIYDWRILFIRDGRLGFFIKDEQPWASAQKSAILSRIHEQTGFFQVRANMSSHLKIAKKSTKRVACILK